MTSATLPVLPVLPVIAALAGCLRAGPPADALGRRAATWEVDVLVAAGDRSIEAHYTLRSERAGGDRWRLSTVRTAGTWTDANGAQAFDSAVPSPADPWPLTLQHAISEVPVEVRVERGRPVALADPAAWQEAARAAVYAAPVPGAALASGEALVDPEGLLDDLARTFPGLPPAAGPWVRAERIAGVDAVRTETCAADGAGWRCEGVAEAAEGSSGKLFEVGTTTEVRVEGRDVVAVTSRYSGTLVTLAPGGGGVEDQPIAGIRSVRRGGR